MTYYKDYFDGGTFWDASKWSLHFHVDWQYFRELRTDVFHHTVNIVRAGQYSILGKDYLISDEMVQEMQTGTRFYSSEFRVDGIPVTGAPTKGQVENIDCLKAAKMLKDQGYNVAVLNMASRQNPGGGVHSGAGAQEENLFRRSNLFQSLYQFVDYGCDYGVKRAKPSNPLD